ncbi:DUF5994 family protein [Williamsia deligens]|uniref:DUF5994 family protein n=1 Tax=Williamsia deligens TaxID=321325 RepID=A0ABW3G8Q9_9NOCA|nr:DUF5994 family protein [Williamsia deligens]MCP2192690.1 hypothetical protein [Williamsia deligens]
MTPSSPVASSAVDQIRLATKAHPTPGDHVDGAWWPASRDLNAEIGGLLDALAPRATPAGRIVVNAEDWDIARNRIIHRYNVIRLDGYRFWPPHMLKVRAVGDTDSITLMVIPPDAPVGAAQRVLAMSSAEDATATVDEMFFAATS